MTAVQLVADTVAKSSRLSPPHDVMSSCAGLALDPPGPRSTPCGISRAAIALGGSGMLGSPYTNASCPFQQTPTRMPTVAPNSVPTIRPPANGAQLAPWRLNDD